MKKYNIKNLLNEDLSAINKLIIIQGWVKHFRNKKFLSVNDGTSLDNIQIFIDNSFINNKILNNIIIGCSIKVIGKVVKSKGEKQNIEIKANYINIYSTKEYSFKIQNTILQPKNHSLKKLRTQSHLRLRTNIFGAIMRIRHNLSFAIHKYFNEKDFFYFHSPIITSIDAEGAGNMFKISSYNNDNKKKEKFFSKSTYLTVSGQLEAETAALSLSKVYTFGPVFRAENSNTSRHLSEFWMVEPEVAFNDIKDNMILAEDFLKNIINYVFNNCKKDLNYLNNNFNNKSSDKNILFNRLEFILNNNFKIVSYSEGVEILSNLKNISFNYPINWGLDLQSEHEVYLVEKYFKCPIILYNYPVDIKAFYMKLNKDEKTVRGMDVLFPYIGEIIGGSQREERYDVLLKQMNKFNINIDKLWWYLDTRKFGTVKHSGFGLGFDRLMQFITGMNNIRDVIPFPRFPKHAEF